MLHEADWKRMMNSYTNLLLDNGTKLQAEVKNKSSVSSIDGSEGSSTERINKFDASSL